ncbi:receptor-like protein EIX2 [Aristolochia californica]|uniref:receptor-like protein EIX2 n=1 Tax=Aristolochia californica TaxID=171875 RepID=UPI0035DADBBC
MFGTSGKTTSRVGLAAQSENRMGNSLFGILFLVISFSLTYCSWVEAAHCKDRERRALTKFRNGLHDPFNRLSSWDDLPDCCKWGGITCNKKTGYVIKLDLLNTGNWNLSGELDPSLLELKHLSYLDLSFNSFAGNSIPPFLGSLSELRYLNLSGIKLGGEIPGSIGNMTSLIELDLSDNGIIGSIPETISNLRNLEVLRLYGNSIKGGMILNRMCRLKKLKVLSLEGCMLSGTIPRCLGELSFLETLDLGSNNLSGVLPETLGQLTHLEMMFIGNNSLSGTITEVHFRNLSKLKVLDMSFNSLALQFHEWSPPFQLDFVILSSCNLGPDFPSWLKLQKDTISILDISNTSISYDIPDWVWDITPQLDILDLSYNKIKGNLPEPLKTKKGGFIGLNSNLFWGPIPNLIGNISDLNISNNNFSGPLPQGLGYLRCFMASNNHIDGTIPSSIGNSTSLVVLDLSENFLQGKIPESLGQIQDLSSLHLNKNNLSGGIPNLLNSSGKLYTIDLSENNLSGDIPAWIGDLQALRRLNLRSNLFTGEIPLQLSKASSLQVLDLSTNKLIGSIPPSFGNLSGMKIRNMYDFSFKSQSRRIFQEKLLVTTKNQIMEYTRTLPLVTSLDLSNNNLVGDVPKELTRLVGLHILNLSANHFTGKISENISNLNLLESLDLSRNQFFGLIPQSLSDLNFLVWLNLSYNNLSGRIPTGQQLGLLKESSYIGNAQLCGPPLSECPDVDSTGGDKATSSNEEGGDDMAWFYAGIGPGFAVGCSGILLTLIFKKSWRIVLFRFADGFSS